MPMHVDTCSHEYVQGARAYACTCQCHACVQWVDKPREEPGLGHHQSTCVFPAATWPASSLESAGLLEPQSGHGRPRHLPAPTEPQDRAAQSQVLTGWQRRLWPAAAGLPAAPPSGRHGLAHIPAPGQEKSSLITPALLLPGPASHHASPDGPDELRACSRAGLFRP